MSSILMDAPREEVMASRLVFIKSQAKIEVEPRKLQRFSLGSFSTKNQPKGFSVEVSDGAEAVATHVETVGAPNRFELVLDVMNNSNSPVTANICRL